MDLYSKGTTAHRELFDLSWFGGKNLDIYLAQVNQQTEIRAPFFRVSVAMEGANQVAMDGVKRP